MRIKINFEKKHLIVLLVLIGIFVGGGIVYGYANPLTGVGHDYSDLQPCGTGKILKMMGTAWGCGDDAAGQWTTSGSNIYYGGGGKVGIGISNPQSPLDVKTSSDACWDCGIRLGDYDSSGAFQLVSDSLGLAFGYKGERLMTLTRGGYVGIGTETPIEELDVSGDIKATNSKSGGAQICAYDSSGDHNCLTPTGVDKGGSGGGVSGTGTINKITKWTSATSIGNSIITESPGNVISVGGDLISTTINTQSIVSGDITSTGSVIMGRQIVQSLPPGNIAGATAYCPSGKVIIGGGCYHSDTTFAARLSISYPNTDSSWTCAYHEANNGVVTAYAICARMG